MKWGLICKPQASNAFDLACRVFDFLKEEGEVYPEKDLASRMGKKKGFLRSEINEIADVVVTIGGDGTILYALEQIDKPIFAINSGGMGFLAEVESKFAFEGLEKVRSGEYNIVERSKLKVEVDDVRVPDAANEVTVHSSKIAKIAYLRVYVGGELIESYGADGVMVSTSTGSTSYALSVGGPLMDPTVPAMIIAPIAPFKLSARPWIVPVKKTVRVEVVKCDGAKVVVDGENAVEVSSESKIIISQSETKARFVRFGESFYQMVRLKLIR